MLRGRGLRPGHPDDGIRDLLWSQRNRRLRRRSLFRFVGELVLPIARQPGTAARPATQARSREPAEIHLIL